MKIGIVGAGHAGVAAARRALELGAEVFLFSAEGGWPYYRPRLPAYAFGQAEPAHLGMCRREEFIPGKIRLLRDMRIEKLEAAGKKLFFAAGSEGFDAVIIATGAGPLVPPFARGLPGVLPLWSLEDAERIRNRIVDGSELVVIGGGILGVEAALRAVKRGMKVTVIERAERLMPGQFGRLGSEYLAGRMRAHGIDMKMGASVEKIQLTNEKRLVIEMDAGIVESDIVLICIGAARDLSMVQASGLDVDRGLRVDRYLQTTAEGVFACGDIIEFPGIGRCSALEALRQGELAAVNAVGQLQGEDLKAHEPSSGAIHFRYEDVQVHTVGEAPGEEEETVLSNNTREFRSLTVREGRVVGAQVIGPAGDFNANERRIMAGGWTYDGN